MSPAIKLSLFASGLFLLTGLATGVWKYQKMMTGPGHRAPVYVDIAHRAALLYSFAALVISKLLEFSPYSSTVNLIAAGAPLFFFAAAIATYVHLGLVERTDNQFQERSFLTTWGMYLLIAGELGGVLILFWGFVRTAILPS